MIYNRRKILTRIFSGSSLLFLTSSLQASGGLFGKAKRFLYKSHDIPRFATPSKFPVSLVMKYECPRLNNLHVFYSDSKSWEDKYALLELIGDFQKSGSMSYTTKTIVEKGSLLRVFFFSSASDAKNYIQTLNEKSIIQLSILEQNGYSLSFNLA